MAMTLDIRDRLHVYNTDEVHEVNGPTNLLSEFY